MQRTLSGLADCGRFKPGRMPCPLPRLTRLLSKFFPRLDEVVTGASACEHRSRKYFDLTVCQRGSDVAVPGRPLLGDSLRAVRRRRLSRWRTALKRAPLHRATSGVRRTY